ncbi:hypothetical protein SSX86_031532 [Deinandra increscens subsp. villosa]|uniref:ATP-dependent DNA helicase n=1 Tax=Deinandra increscens subsp. villosa TaxID=3103831 RepID=A0AAP0GHL1_9ASTR
MTPTPHSRKKRGSDQFDNIFPSSYASPKLPSTYEVGSSSTSSPQQFTLTNMDPQSSSNTQGFFLTGYLDSTNRHTLNTVHKSNDHHDFVLTGYMDSTKTHTNKRNHNRRQKSVLFSQVPTYSYTFGGDYKDLGDCTQICEFCKATFWFAERLKSYPLSRRPRYNICCSSGRVALNYPRSPPVQLRCLYQDKLFLSNIRQYNSMFAMTSFGATIDESVTKKSGPFVFKVSGQICHWLGSLCPTVDRKPSFLQLYFYDTANEISNRLDCFSSQRKNTLDASIIRVLITTLDQHNELVKLFRTARDICQTTDIPNLSVQLYQGINKHPYEIPSMGTLGAIISEANPNAEDFDIIIRNKSDVPQRVNNLHPSYMSLQYPLLFPYGEQGWTPTLRLSSNPPTLDDDRLSMNMFYTYQIHDRPTTYTILLNAGRLFQQYLVDAYICIERNRLNYFRSHQNDLRTEFLSGIYDAISRGDSEGQSIGRRIILPSSFTGGPRYMYKHYQDALAICRVHGNPQYFITFTCNVKWPEIIRHMARNPLLTPQDRSDIIARVFQMKVEEFMDFLKKDKPFGVVSADLYTIEFQKRGLPHCHTLLWVTKPFQIKSPDQIDDYISAELPNEEIEPTLFRIVTNSMIHGPCGLANKKFSCMQNGKCSKHYPMKHETLTRFDEKGHVHYKRRANGPSVCKHKIMVDNRYVVPYNKKLCNRFHAHINVEYCGSSMFIKYLFKYISKGTDRIRYSITSNSSNNNLTEASSPTEVDEIKNFEDGRFICPQEAAWRILNFHIHKRNPTVQALQVHLQGQQNITFKGQNILEQVIGNPISSKTTLTEWLQNNNKDPTGLHLRYVDYLSEYRWVTHGKFWLRRTSKKKPSIGRLVYIHPRSGELFFMRMLLNHQTGCCSFEDIKTVNGIIMPTYRAACEKLGLIGNDREWELTLEDAALWATPSQIRHLFTHLLLFCEISNPLQLWEKYWEKMADDFSYNITQETNIESHCIPPDALQQRILYELAKLLHLSSTSSTLSEFGLPMPQGEYTQLLDNILIMEERFYDRNALTLENQNLRSTMHPRQYEIYNTVMQDLAKDKQVLLFIYGHGGTGKTFLWKAITSGLRSIGKIVLTVAASGIASLLLPSGRTAHSRFKIPIKITEESLCNVNKATKIAELLIDTSLIIWDEAPMSDRRCFEALDRTLKDILDNPDKPFGGKSILLGGDFRQTLPIKKNATKSTQISLSLPRSKLWPDFKVFRLTENMRLYKPHMSNLERESVEDFSNWLLSVGDGKIGSISRISEDIRDICIPENYVIPYSDNALRQLIDFIYDHDTLQCPNADNLHDKAIVCPKNNTADEINQLVLEMAHGTVQSYFSTDSLKTRTDDCGDNDMLYPIEYLNSLSFPGMPPHHLELKKNTPIMLLRNLNPSTGLCNGTRLIITQLLPRLIEADIITGTCIGKRVFIPRIPFLHDDQELPFIFTRRQFPIRLCYAMTINKSQGQSLNKIGIYLPQHVFGHGQLYVALSRATSPTSLKVVVVPQEDYPPNTTQNLVFSDFLQEINQKQVMFTLTHIQMNYLPTSPCLNYIFSFSLNHFYIQFTFRNHYP